MLLDAKTEPVMTSVSVPAKATETAKIAAPVVVDADGDIDELLKPKIAQTKPLPAAAVNLTSVAAPAAAPSAATAELESMLDDILG